MPKQLNIRGKKFVANLICSFVDERDKYGLLETLAVAREVCFDKGYSRYTLFWFYIGICCKVIMISFLRQQ